MARQGKGNIFMEIRDIKIPIPGAGQVRWVDNLEAFEWQLTAEIHGEVRELGKLFNFRFEAPNTCIADFDSGSMYGDQLIRDYNERNVSFSVHLSPERDSERVPNWKEGKIQFCVTGWLMMPEPPTTVCDDCEQKFPAMDAQEHGGSQEQWFMGYRSLEFPSRVVCPKCHKKGATAGRYREKEDGQEGTAENN